MSRRYVATSYGAQLATPQAYRVWLVDDESEKHWIRMVSVQDLHHLDASVLAERLNREVEAGCVA